MNGYVFYGLIDFFENKETILKIYQKLNIDEIEIYKMYVYSLPFMEDDIKDNIWEYLNGSLESRLILKSKYEKEKRKLEKRRLENEIHNTY
jgi:hypothetical protein